MKENGKNYFIIERIDNEGESNNLKNIYDLSVLNRVKEIKLNTKNKNKIKNLKKISQNQKERIIQVVKKAILSANLTYKRKTENFKNILIIFHLLILVSALASNFKDQKRDSLLSIYFNHFLSNKNSEYNISQSLNGSINNFTNDTEKFLTNSSNYNSTNIKEKQNIRKLILMSTLLNEIVLIPILLVFFYRYIPKWEKINDIIYKITNYLLYCESLNKGKYYYQLMKNYSILVVKKKYFSKYKKLPEELKAQHISPINTIKNRFKMKKNIFSYCINIINDFTLDDLAIINYQKLISNEDLADINILIKYIENSLHEKLKKYTKRILIPISLLILISLYKSKYWAMNHFFSSLIFFSILIMGKIIFKEYYNSYKKSIDKFIDNFNVLLIQKNKFIYRKDRLIMFFALKSNKYTKKEIINAIKKIIA